MKKTGLKCRTWTKKFRARLEKIFSHINFSLSQKQRYEQKPLFSLRSSLLFSTKITPNFFTRFISRFKNHSNKIDLKKGLLQYSSSSRKKTAPLYNSNSLNCKNTSAIIAGWEDEGGY